MKKVSKEKGKARPVLVLKSVKDNSNRITSKKFNIFEMGHTECIGPERK